MSLKIKVFNVKYDELEQVFIGNTLKTVNSVSVFLY